MDQVYDLQDLQDQQESTPRGQEDLVLFALEGSRMFGGRVAEHLGLSLTALEERVYEDRERKARPLVSVRGRDVYVIHSLYADDHQSGNDKLCNLLFFIGALKDASAARVTAVVPYLAYARKDRKSKPRDPVTTRYVAALFEAVGTDAVVTMDVHNLAAFQNAFRCPTENLEANPLFVEHFAALLNERAPVIVSPDAGASSAPTNFVEALHMHSSCRSVPRLQKSTVTTRRLAEACW